MEHKHTIRHFFSKYSVDLGEEKHKTNAVKSNFTLLSKLIITNDECKQSISSPKSIHAMQSEHRTDVWDVRKATMCTERYISHMLRTCHVYLQRHYNALIQSGKSWTSAVPKKKPVIFTNELRFSLILFLITPNRRGDAMVLYIAQMLVVF